MRGSAIVLTLLLALSGLARAAGPQTDDRAATLTPSLPAPARTNAMEQLSLSIEEAVLMALENNRGLRVERIQPLIQQTAEQVARSVFDPIFRGDFSVGESKTDYPGSTNSTVQTSSGRASLDKTFTLGTDVSLGFETSSDSSRPDPLESISRVGLAIRQPLLRGAGPGVNRASIRQARIDTLLSEYELRAFAETLVANVEQAYWEYVLARRQIEIYERSLQLAEQQHDETSKRVQVGSLAETELAAARAEMALRREALINARSRAAALRARLVRMVHPVGLGGHIHEVIPLSEPKTPTESTNPLSEHLDVARWMRPDLNEARLRLARQNLEIVKTRNGLLPKLDVFVNLGMSGYASSFGDSVADLNGDHVDAKAGISLEYPIARRQAKARHRSALLTRVQIEEAMANLDGLASEDIELACIEVDRTREQMAATSATRALQEENLRAETAKFRSGKTTSLSVAQVQRDLVSSQIAEVEAIVRHLQALVALYRSDGTLLLRRRIDAPGDTPPDD